MSVHTAHLTSPHLTTAHLTKILLSLPLYTRKRPAGNTYSTQRNPSYLDLLGTQFFIHAYEWKNKIQQTFEGKQWLPKEVPRLGETELILDKAETAETERDLRKKNSN